MKLERLFDFLDYQQKNYPREDSLVTKKNGVWEKTSTQEYINKANSISRGFLKLGLKHGDKIAIASTTNRTEWNLLDIGLQQIGCISVPVYPTISSEDYVYIFNDSEVKFAFVSDEELFQKITTVKDKIPSLIGVYTFDDVKGAPNLKEILDLGSDVGNQHEVDAVKEQVKEWLFLVSRSRTRTYDLRVMSPTSFQLLYPASCYITVLLYGVLVKSLSIVLSLSSIARVFL